MMLYDLITYLVDAGGLLSMHVLQCMLPECEYNMSAIHDKVKRTAVEVDSSSRAVCECVKESF